LAWAELLLEPFVPGRLAKVFDPLLKQHRFNTTHFQRPDGLFFGDCWGCGMDNLPRWDDPSEVTPEGGIPFGRNKIAVPGAEGDALFEWMNRQTEMPFFWNRQLGWCDTSCQMAFNALNLGVMAHRLGRDAEEAELRRQHAEIAAAINELCYDEAKGFYFDRLGGKTLSRRTICGFWPLLAEVATPERAGRLVEELRNPARFNRPCGIPTLAADDPDYDPESGYARGPAWAHTNYMVLAGLEKYGERQLARDFAQKLYRAAETLWEKTGTIWENYSPEQADHPPARSCRDFCGWSALIPIAIYREYLP